MPNNDVMHLVGTNIALEKNNITLIRVVANLQRGVQGL